MAGQTFTLSEVKNQEYFIVVDGVVYDVERFIDFHPGSRNTLKKYCGTDASEEFHLFHHDGVLLKYGDKLKVGTLSNYAPKNVVIPFAEPNQGLHSPYYKDSHHKLRRTVREFVDTEILATMDSWKYDTSPKNWRHIFEKMGKMGLIAMICGTKDYPAEFLDEGVPVLQDFDYFHSLIVLDEISRCGNPGIIAALTNGPAVAVSALLAFDREKKANIIRDVLNGRKFIALAISEPTAGSDVAGLSTYAVKRGNHYVINGNKKWITNAIYADFLVAAVRTDSNPDVPATAATSLVLIETNMPGISMRKLDLGQLADIQGTAFIDLDNVTVPQSNLIGDREGTGFMQIMGNFNFERFYLAVLTSRLSRICVEESFKFAMKRKTFGKTLIEHDVIKLRLAQMSARVEQQHAFLEHICYQMCCLSKPEYNKLGHLFCGTKALGSLAFEEVASGCTEIFGGNSLDSASVGRRIKPMVDAVKGYLIPGGSLDIMLMQMTKLSLKHAARL